MTPPPPRTGSWLSLGSPVIAELAANSGFDWLLFDLEHGFTTDGGLLPQLQALKGTPTDPIVRVGAPHADLVLRVLDWGAKGIMVPHVSSVAEAEACVRAAHYPPRGHRGFSRSARCHGYGMESPDDPASIPPPLVMAQIENIDGVKHARDIARVEGIDVLFVGPADLQFDLRARPQSASQDYAACLREVNEAAREAGKETGILIRDTADLSRHLEMGFTWVAIDSDLAILRKGYQSILGPLKHV